MSWCLLQSLGNVNTLLDQGRPAHINEWQKEKQQVKNKTLQIKTDMYDFFEKERKKRNPENIRLEIVLKPLPLTCLPVE